MKLNSTDILLIIMISLLLFSGCIQPDFGFNNSTQTNSQTNDNMSVLNNNTASISNTNQQPPVTTSTHISTPDADSKAKLTGIAPFQGYKANMTNCQGKLSTVLLQLIDPNFPKSGNTPDEMKAMLSKNHQLMYADEAIRKFDIRPTSNQTIGDNVDVYILVNASVSTKNVESYTSKVNYVFEDFTGANRVQAWVDLNNLEKIASLKEVIGIDLVFPGHTDQVAVAFIANPVNI